MAGKERSGFDASEASLFYNASYILVPGEAPQSATDTLVSLAKSMGFGTIKYCTQQKHDRMIAYTSQIPHVLACAYVMSRAAMSTAAFPPAATATFRAWRASTRSYGQTFSLQTVRN